jgi:hypothetical protein
VFVIAQSPSYWWPVKVRLAAEGDDAGKVVEQDFEIEFNRFGVEEMEALNKRILTESLKDHVIVPMIARNWRKVVDDKQQSLQWSSANVAAVLNISGVASAIVDAFHESRRLAAEKN